MSKGRAAESPGNYDEIIDAYLCEGPQEHLPGYEIGKVLGRGTFSTCFLGSHQVTNSRVAIKRIARKDIDLSFLRREVKIWNNLDHPNIVRLFEVIPMPNHFYLTMEYADSGELFRWLENSGGGLPLRQALEICQQICWALMYLHAKGVAHRDLKLENILLSRRQEGDLMVKVSDFGFAVSNERSCREWLGSSAYTAPEILQKKPYDPYKGDCWSLGITLFALLTGYLPFSHVEDDEPGVTDIDQKIRQRVRQGSYQIPPHLDRDIAELIGSLLEVDPARRLSAEDTFRRLNAIIHRRFGSPPLKFHSKEESIRGSPFDASITVQGILSRRDHFVRLGADESKARKDNDSGDRHGHKEPWFGSSYSFMSYASIGAAEKPQYQLLDDNSSPDNSPPLHSRPFGS
jgi:serine/threonine protein kinase